jgi:hypothetical protein
MARKSYVQIMDENGKYKLIPKEEYVCPEKRTAFFLGDIKPYKSTITGEMITSRSKHREHLRQHGCIEVGNEFVQPKRKRPDREAIRRELYSNWENVSQIGPR